MTFTLTELATILGLLIALITPLLAWVWTVSGRLSTLELKTNTIWEFQMRRAISEAVDKGIGKLNSPYQTNPDVLDRARVNLGPLIVAHLRALRKQFARLSDPDLALEIERYCGNVLMQQMCLPYGLRDGACLLIALDLAKESRNGN